MKILVAPDSFKDSITSNEFCNLFEKVINKNWPKYDVIKIPLADGGEGTVDSLVHLTNGKFIKKQIKGPLRDEIIAKYGIIQKNVAIIEMASASGLQLIDKDKRNPMHTTTYGTGQLILDAIKKGCKKIIIGIGGSATNDGGLGMMQALGYKCLNEEGKNINYGGKGLLELKKIIKPKNINFENIEFKVACDVNNPLYGKNGAAYTYARQKGASIKEIEKLDKGLKNLSEIFKKDLNKDIAYLKGAGAAGGLGAGLAAGLDAKLLSGFEIIKNQINLDKKIDNSIDLIITGEGELNKQSLNGKLPIEISKLGKKKNINTVLIVGKKDLSLKEVKKFGVIGIFSIIDKPSTLDESIKNTNKLLKEKILNIFSLIDSLKSD